MVAVVTGAGLGLDRSSLASLGSQGQLGTPTFGSYGENVTVNAANGNLVIQRTDEILTGVGLSDVITGTYNSLSSSTGYGASNGWQTNDSRSVWGLTGTVDTAGSTVYRTDSDGSVETYSWNAADNAYVCTQAGNADDQLTFSSTSNTWTWTDLQAGTTEVYDASNGGRLMSSTDANGNTLTYSYTGSLLTQVTTADGEYTQLIYSGDNLAQITTHLSGGSTLTSVYYTYDSQNRLSTVTTALTPADNSESEGGTVVTTYGYQGTTNLITSISETGGAQLAIAYNSSNEVSSLTQTTASGVTSTTSFSYGSGTTSITDNNGNVTHLSYDSAGDLTQIQAPPAQSGAAAQIYSYTYNSNGDVLTATDPLGNVTTNTYDGNDNLLTTTDPLGNVTTYTYNADNQVLTATMSGPGGVGSLSAGNENLLVSNIGDTTTFNPIADDTYTSGDSVTITAVSSPSYGTATIVDGGTGIQYTRTGAGADSFTYTVTDSLGHTATATVTVADSATASNTAPVAGNVSVQITGVGSTLTFNPLAYDSDANGYALTITGVSSPTNGTATIVDGGQGITYTRSVAGNDSFTYTISDGHGHTATATITVVDPSVPSNTAPTAGNVSVQVAGVGSTLTFNPLADDSDVNGYALTITSVSSPTNGTATIVDGGQGITYTRTSSGNDSFTYTISDGHGHTATATVSVADAFVPVSEGPTAGNVTIAAPGVDSSLTFDPRAVDSDPNGYALTITSVSSPTHGTATIGSGGTSITYTQSSAGTDSFTYTVSDGHGYTATGTVSTSTFVEQPPTAPNVSFYLRNGEHESWTINPIAYAIDENGDPLTITAVSTPSQGTATIIDSGTAITYTSAGTGGATFTYTVSDGHGGTATGTVTVIRSSTYTSQQVQAVNDSYIVTGVGTEATFSPLLNDSNYLADSMTITSVSTPLHGTVSIVDSGTEIQYTRTSVGTDSFTYTVTSDDTTATAVVTVADSSADTTQGPPVAASVSVEVANTHSAAITFDPRALALDANGYAMTITSVSTPGSGTATIIDSGTAITYTRPSSGTIPGSTSFTYTLSDGHGETATATVTVYSGSYNTQQLTALNQSLTVTGVEVPTTFNPLANAANLLAYGMTVSSVSTPANGTAIIADGGTEITYTQTTAAPDSFTYTVSDGHGNTATATVFVNSPPQTAQVVNAVNDNVIVGSVGTATVFNPLLNDSNLFAYAMSITAVSTPSRGTATIVDGGTEISYTPSSVGTDSFTYTISDGHGGTATATVNIAPAIVAPQVVTASSENIIVDGSAVTFNPLLNSANFLAYGMTITAVSTPSRGTATIIDGGTEITYTPTSTGTDSFTYTLSDGHGNTATATVSVIPTVEASQVVTANNKNVVVNAVGDTATFDPLLNDANFLAYGMTITAVSSPSHGTATIVDGGTDILYTRTSAGADSFTYTISDGHGDTATATVSVTGSTSGGAVSPGPSQTTRYVYDSKGNLDFIIGGDGEVTQYLYNGYGQQTSAITYTNNPYNLSGLAPTTSPSLSTMTSWVAGIGNLSTNDRTDTTYDFRGNVSTVTTYSAVNATTGVGLTTQPYTVVTYVYDPSGNLLSKQTSGASNSEVYTYDGLNRITSATNLNGGTTSYQYNNSTNTTVTTSPTGLTTTSVYNLAGELISTTQAGSNFTTATTTYAYDDLGNLCMVTDATGDVSYFLYDTLGRKVADIAADGSITEYRYNADNQVVATVSYATKLTSTQLASLVNTSGVPTDPALSTVTPSASSGDVWSWNVYDNDNRLVETINGDGDATVFAYDIYSNLISTTSYANTLSSSAVSGFKTTPPTSLQLPTADPGEDDITRYFYNNEGQVIATLDGNGYLTQTTYNDAGEVVETLASANAAASSLRAAGTLAQLQTSVGTSSHDIATNYVYDDQGNLRYTINANLVPTEYDYSDAGQLLDTIQYAGAIAAPSSYTVANVQSAISTAGLSSNTGNRKTWSVYDTATGNLDYTIDAMGDVTQYKYNSLGQVTKVTQFATLDPVTSSPSQATMDSWAAGQASDTANRITRSIYNVDGQLIYSAVVYDAAGDSYVTQYGYDAAGRLTSQIQYATAYTVSDTTTQASLASTIGTVPSSAVQTSYSYNADGQLTDTYNGLGIDTHLTYDALGRVTSSTVAYGLSDASTTQYTYDAANRVLTETQAYGDPEAATTSYTYDGMGHVLTMTDPNGNATSYTYDALGDVLTSTDPTGAVTTNTYDAFGNVQTSINALGGTSYFFYDLLNRLTLEVDPMGYATATSYTIGNEIASVTHYATPVTGTITAGTPPTITTSSQDATTSFTRDLLGRVTQSTDAVGNTEEFAYDAFGDQISVTNQLGGATTYTFDNRGLMLSETLPETSTRANGTVEATSVTNTYSYDSRGNRTQMVEASGLTEQRTTNYTYDKLNRLTQISGDAVTVTANNLNSTSSVTPITTYTYDDRGNVIETVDAMGNATFDYYDHLNRKIAEINAVGTQSAWTYDADGNVTASTVYGTAVTLPTTPGGSPPSPVNPGTNQQTTYTYDKDDRLLTTTVASVLTGAYNGSSYATTTGNITTTNVYDALGDLIKQTNGDGNSVYTYYDKSGRQIAQVDQDNYLTTYALDQNGNVTEEYEYANKLTTTPTTSSSVSALVSNAGTSTNDRITTFTYDKNGNRLTETRENVAISTVNALSGALTTTTGNSTITYAYNGLGEVTRQTQATGDYTAYTYDSEGRQTQVQLSSFTGYTGATVQNTTAEYYDGLNNLTRTSEYDADNSGTTAQVTTYTYGAGGRLATMTDADGFTRTYAYDADGQTMMVSYARLLSNGTTVTEADAYQYDALGRQVFQSVATLSGSTWTFGDEYTSQYNAYGEVASTSVNGIVQQTYAYNNAGQLQSTTNDGVTQLYLYDADGNQTLAIASDGVALPTGDSWSTLTLAQAIAILTNNGANAIGATDPSASGLVATITVYDPRGQATQTIQPFRQLSVNTSGGYNTQTLTATKVYDAFGDVVQSTDANGNVTNYAYSTLGKLTQIQQPTVNYTEQNGTILSGRPTTNYYYDVSGRQVGVEDANGNLTTETLLADTGYEGSSSAVLKTFDPDGGISSNLYDVFGNLRQSTNQVGDATTYTYDAMGRLLSQTNPTVAADSPGNDTGSAITLIDYYAYDGLGQRIQSWNSELGSSDKATTDYDSEGRVIKSVDLDGYATTYSYVWSAGAATVGLGTFGGWIKTTTNSTGLSESETDNVAGTEIALDGFNSFDTSYTFDLAGRLATATENYDEDATITYGYYNTNLVASESSSYTISGRYRAGPSTYLAYHETYSLTSTYAYDANGNRTLETYSANTYSLVKGINNTTSYEDATVEWDALNRMVSLNDTGNDASTSAAITWEYDLNSNVVKQATTYTTLTSTGAPSSSATQTEWFAYDSMNREVIYDGTQSGSTIVAGSGGTAITYDAAGDRVTSTDSSGESAYTYDAAGQLAQVTIAGNLAATYAMDAMGRVLQQNEYNSAGTSIVYSKSATYDADSNITSDAITTVRSGSGGTLVQDDTYSYVSSDGATNLYDGANGSYQGGAVTNQQTTTSLNGGAATTSNLETEYVWAGGQPDISETLYTPNTASPGTVYNTNYTYGQLGNLSVATINDGSPRQIAYVTNLAGQILSSTMQTTSGGAFTGPSSVYYFFDGVQEGEVSNNGTNNVDYTSSIAEQTATPGSGFFTDGATSGASSAQFGTTLQGINALGNQTDTSPTYTVQAGDTLQSVAQELWGNSSYWYLLADANGLSADATLSAGQILNVPQVVSSSQNNASTNTVYNASEAIGNISPTHPPAPPKNGGGCGAIGEILLAIVAVAVTVLTYGAASAAAASVLGVAEGSTEAAVVGGAIAGAAGSVVSQGVGLATGLQSQFNWAAVGEAAIGGAVGGGIASTGAFSGLSGEIGSFGVGALQGITGSLVSQGLDVATGLQSKFSWAGVAAAGVGAAAGAEAGTLLPPSSFNLGSSTLNSEASGFVSGIAGVIANAATRTLISGTDFGDNIIAALPDAIGQTIDETVAASQTPNPTAAQAQATPQPSSSGLSQAELDDITNTINNLPVEGGVTGDDEGTYTPPQLAVSQEIAGNNEYGYPILRTTYNDGSTIDESYLPPPTAAPVASAAPPPLDPVSQFLNGFSNAIVLPFLYAGQAGANLIENPQPAIQSAENFASNAWRNPVGTAESVATGAWNFAKNGVQTIYNNYETAAQNGTLPEFAGAVVGNVVLAGVGGEELSGVEAAQVATTDVLDGDGVVAVATGAQQSAVISSERATQLLVDNGIDAETAEQYAKSFDGPITVRLVQPQEQFLRYADYPNGTGGFLTQTEFESPSAAVEGLNLGPYNNSASLVQPVTAVRPALVLEGGIAGGGAGVQQTFVVDRSAFEYGTGVEYGQ